MLDTDNHTLTLHYRDDTYHDQRALALALWAYLSQFAKDTLGNSSCTWVTLRDTGLEFDVQVCGATDDKTALWHIACAWLAGDNFARWGDCD